MRAPLLLVAFVLALPVVLGGGAPVQAAVQTGVNETQHQTLPTPVTAARLRADWVRVWIAWDEVQPAPGPYEPHAIGRYARRITALQKRGIKVLAVVHRSPAWAAPGRGATAPPDDPAAYGAFVAGLAARLRAVDAWELWNEPDGPEFFLGGPAPATYAALVKAAYPAIKAVAPRDVVLTGGLVGNHADFVEELYRHGAKGSFDAVAVHTDTACLTNGPGFAYRDERGRVGRYTFTGHREVHDVMARHGDGAKRIWMTEIGWNSQSTEPNSCTTGMWKGRKPLGVSTGRQARLLTKAYRCAATDPFVGPVFWFGLQDIPGSAHAGGYGLFRADGTAKPAARAFRRLARGVRPGRRRCGMVVDHVAPALRVPRPADGLRFSGKLSVRVTAVDNRGGTGLERTYLSVGGRHVASWEERTGRLEPWWATARWKPGVYTLAFRSVDRAGNETSRTVRVEKVRRRAR